MLLYFASLIHLAFFVIYRHLLMSWYFVPFSFWVVFYDMDTPWFVHSSTAENLSLFVFFFFSSFGLLWVQLLWTVKPVCKLKFPFPELITRIAISELYATYMYLTFQKLWNYFPSCRCCCLVSKLCPTLRPHGLQCSRLPCPSPSPRVSSNSCALSQWCPPTISSSVAKLYHFAKPSANVWECCLLGVVFVKLANLLNVQWHFM